MEGDGVIKASQDDVDGLAALSEARESIVTNGPMAGCRQIELRVPDGVDLRIVPDRGFDIAQAWWRGYPLAWADQSRHAPPTPNPRGLDWIRSFSGGLLTTCGLRHIGPPKEEHGLHGRYSHLRSDVRFVGVSVKEGVPVASANALIHEPDSFGPLLEMDRTISTRADTAHVDVSDIVTNRGMAAESVKLLYHLNFTYVDGESTSLLIDGESVSETRLAGAADTIELPVPDGSPVTLRLHNKRLNAVAALTWNSAVFSRLFLWMYPTSPTGGILAIEPSTGPLVNTDTDETGGIKLDPGEGIQAGFTLTMEG